MKNRKIIIGLVLIFVVLMFLSRCGDNSSNKISLKNGVFPLASELRMDMSINDLPQKWKPNYSENAVGYGIAEGVFMGDGYSNAVVVFEGLEFDTKVQIDSTIVVEKDFLEQKNVIAYISSEPHEYVSNKKILEIAKKLKSYCGEPVESTDATYIWESGNYRLELINNGGLFIKMYQYKN